MRSAVVEVAKVHARELGSKDVFKELIREGGDFAVQYLEGAIFPPPPVKSPNLRPTGGLFGRASRSYRTLT
ncbi:hypothetical protein IG631_23407 [Alternaria alternata]|nr:hypothetical protein IG631_23407 [Alternaria alternata]